jgi:hypothetical protein
MTVRLHLLLLLFLSAPAFSSDVAPSAKNSGKVSGEVSGEVRGEVTLAKGVQLKPGGVLFIFAKKSGNPMPAAVLRIPDPKLPLEFSLSGKNAMVPGAPFDGPFTITARYSPGGDVMDKSGPEGVHAKPIAVGTTGIKLELKSK